MADLSIPQELLAAARRLRTAPERPVDELQAALLERSAWHLAKARPAYHAVLVDPLVLDIARVINAPAPAETGGAR